MIEVLASGPQNIIQDLGRVGALSIGVGRSGAMDADALEIGNLLAGNPSDAAGIELAQFPFRVCFHEAARFALTGADAPARLDGELLPPWWSVTAAAGQVLEVGVPQRGGRAYLCVVGGIDLPRVLGSRATDLKSGFGGCRGRGLRRGERLALGSVRAYQTDGSPETVRWGVVPREVTALRREIDAGCVPLRVLPGAEFEHFTPQSQALFEAQYWEITQEANRMGYRMAGEALVLSQSLELLSHGILPGVIQVPPSGQPIVQLAEANTCGGYPKIATVISADLWKFGQLLPGDRVRFRLVSMEDALQALWARAEVFEELRATAQRLGLWRPTAGEEKEEGAVAPCPAGDQS
jgi:biotin-dependent carboxylase-like uncharacterized protein